MLTAADVHDYNAFDKPELVKPVEFGDFKVKGDKIIVKMPAMAIVSLTVEI